MIRGVHTMFYTSHAKELREFLRDKLGFTAHDAGGGWLIFDMPEADMGCHPTDHPGHIGSEWGRSGCGRFTDLAWPTAPLEPEVNRWVRAGITVSLP
jgi:catechol 2,3-dioxygenase-like lactoylglutathione lyase family enzyme